MAILACNDLKYLYSVDTPFETAAIHGINFEAEEGDIVGIIGHTGSGKSTFIQHLNGLLKPHEGTVFFDGKNIWAKENEKNIRAVRFAVGLCFQYPEHQIFEDDIFKEISFGPKQMGLDEEEIKARVYESMQFVGIDRALEHKSPFDLSGGQKRRVAIASIIAMRPQVLILDEPCAGLDPQGRETVLSMIKNYQKTMGNTVLFVSHSMEDVAKICEKVLVLNQGTVAMYGSVADVYSRGNELKNMGLNVPQVTEIFLKLKEAGVDCSTSIFTVEAAEEEIKRLQKTGQLPPQKVKGGAAND